MECSRGGTGAGRGAHGRRVLHWSWGKQMTASTPHGAPAVTQSADARRPGRSTAWVGELATLCVACGPCPAVPLNSRYRRSVGACWEAVLISRPRQATQQAACRQHSWVFQPPHGTHHPAHCSRHPGPCPAFKRRQPPQAAAVRASHRRRWSRSRTRVKATGAWSAATQPASWRQLWRHPPSPAAAAACSNRACRPS